MLSREILCMRCADIVKSNKLFSVTNRDYYLLSRDSSREIRFFCALLTVICAIKRGCTFLIRNSNTVKRLLSRDTLPLCYIYMVRAKESGLVMPSRDSCREIHFSSVMLTLWRERNFHVSLQDCSLVIRNSDAVKGFLCLLLLCCDWQENGMWSSRETVLV